MRGKGACGRERVGKDREGKGACGRERVGKDMEGKGACGRERVGKDREGKEGFWLRVVEACVRQGKDGWVR